MKSRPEVSAADRGLAISASRQRRNQAVEAGLDHQPLRAHLSLFVTVDWLDSIRTQMEGVVALLRALDLRPPASWAARTSGGVKPGPTRRAAESEAATAVPLATAKAAGARSGGKVKVGAQMEIGTRQFTPFKTKYGDLQITATVKATGAFVLASGGDLDVGINVASKDKKDSRATGTKKSIGWKGFDERTLLDGFDLKDLSLAAEFEISGTDVTVACAFSFFVVTHSFAARPRPSSSSCGSRVTTRSRDPASRSRWRPRPSG